MTLNTTYKPAVAEGNGIIKEFSYSFNPISSSYIKVYFEIEGKWVEQKTGWSATVSDNGGVVTFLNAPTTRVSIERDVPESQPTSYTTSSGFQAKVIENSFDLLTGMIQELKDASDRSVKVEVGDNQTPEELLEEVYSKLDSATEIAEDAIIAANQAQVAADNATAAVESAEQTLVETQAYVDSAKIEINNTKETAIEEVDIKVTDAKADINSTVVTAQANITSVKDTAIDAVEDAVADLGQTVTDAKADIDNTKTAAETSITNTVNQGKADIQGYVDDAEGEVRQIAREEAQEAIAEAKQDVQAYADTTIKPSLQTYVDSASASEQVATASADTAVEKAAQASASATSAQSSAATAEEWARYAEGKGNPNWGYIGGDIENQADLMMKFDTIDDKIKEIELFKFPNANIIGEPIIQSGQVSGFSTVSYLQFPFIMDLRGNPFQIDFSFTTATNVQVQQNILDSRFGMAIAIKDGKGLMAISSNGTSWNIGQSIGTMDIESNTTYYARVTWDGMQYKTFLSTNGTDYVQDMTLVGTQAPFPRTMFIGGCNQLETGHEPHPFLGSINLNKAYLSIRGSIVWQGMDDAGLATRADVSLSNLDSEGQAKFDAKQDISSLSQTLDNSTTKYPSNAAVKAAIDAKDSLPSQAGNDGKFLTTDGTTASWSKVSGFYNRVHDCILENPRYIIWEQDGNTLTLKAGTKLWYPDGRSVVLENDISGTMTSSSNLVWVDLENNSLLFKDAFISGPTTSEYTREHPEDYTSNGTVFYDQTENKFKTSNGSAWVGDWTVPLPVKSVYNSTTYTRSLVIDESTFNKGMIVFRTGYGDAEYIFIPEGIKTLACSGLKADGSYNNVEYTTPGVMALDETSAYSRPHYFAIKTDGTVQISDSGFKVTDDNYLQNLSTNEVFSGVRLGNHRDEFATNIYDTLDLQNSTRVFYWDD